MKIIITLLFLLPLFLGCDQLNTSANYDFKVSEKGHIYRLNTQTGEIIVLKDKYAYRINEDYINKSINNNFKDWTIEKIE